MTVKLYRFFILLLKASIIATTAGFVLYIPVIYYQTGDVLYSYFLGIGFMSWLFQLISAMALRLGRPYLYCLWTVFILYVLGLVDYEIGLPIDTPSFCAIHAAILIVMLICIGCDRLFTKPRPEKGPSVYGGKIMMATLKSFPVIIAAGIAARYVLTLFSTLGDYDIYSIMFGCSFVSIFFMYVASIVFRFCSYHRFCILYIFLSHTLATLIWYYIIPESWAMPIIISMTIISLIIFTALYIHVKYHQKTAQPNA